jgi:acyl-CoA reductase-like NAD-dependent aldehyde dehydrogenase
MSRTTEVPDLRPFIHGVHVDSHTNVTLPSIDPAAETELWTLPAGDVADVDAAVDSARDAFDHGPWRHDPSARSTALLRLADLVETHAARIALLDTLEVGIPIGVTTADAAGAAAILRDIVVMADSVADDVTAPSVRLPRGVIATIAPWNFPFFVALTKIAPALATGNVVVLKPSEIASASALLTAELAMEAGFPPGVLNVVPGRGAVVGDALVRRRGVDQVNLTGSLATGRAVLRASAESTLVPVVTELGGKSAHVVTKHAPDLDTVADAIAAGIFWCAGQVCTSGSRVIVHERHHDELLERLVARAGAWLPRDPHDPETQAGPLATAEHLARVHRHVQTAVESGARLVAGGEPGPRPGWFFPPTILDGVTPGHRVFHEEVFGPVLAVTTCTSTAEAVELANATEYGLSATGWSTDPDEAAALAHQLRGAWVFVNPHTADPPAPTAGAESLGSSGNGVEGGMPGLRATTRVAMISTGVASTPEEDPS